MRAATRTLIAGEWRANPGRVVVAIVAIAIGVALGFAVHVVNASALDRFARGVATVAGRADLRVEAASPGGLDDRDWAAVKRAPGVAAASAVVELPARLGATSARLVGIDVLQVAGVTPALLPRPAGDDPLAAFDPRSVFLSARAAGGRRTGAMVTIVAAGRAERFRIAGDLPQAADAALAVVDIAAAQDRFGRFGRIDRIDVRLADGAEAAAVRRALAAAAPSAVIADAADEGEQADALSRAYRVNLDMLALVALLTGAFLVYSAQALSVARRRREFALVRVLGASPRALVAQVLAEGLVLGIVGSLLGLALGLGVAAATLRLVGGDLGASAFAGEGVPPLRVTPAAAAIFAALGLAASLLGSLLPARAVAAMRPARALRDSGDLTDPARVPAIAPSLLLALAAVPLALLPAVGGVPIAGYAAIALLLAAGIGAMPWAARRLLAPLATRKSGGLAFTLAVRRLWGAPSQAAVALAGIVASIGLTVAMAVMVTSFRGSVDDWLRQLLVADVYLSLPAGGTLAAADQRRIALLPGVGRASFAHQLPLTLDPAKPPPVLIVRDDPGIFPTLGRTRAPVAGTMPVWISEPAARVYALAPGDRLRLPVRGGTPASVVAVFRDYARQQGALMVRGRDWRRLTSDASASEAALTLAPGARPAAVIEAVRGALPRAIAGATQVVPTRELRARALAIFDRSFAITYALEAVAVAVGLAGVAATVSAQTIARAREFGMLRHLGFSRATIGRMLAIEGALIGALGAVGGLALGAVIAQLLIHVVNPQSFNFTMATRWPIGLLAGVAVALVVCASLTALVAGRRAMSADAVRAVREDW